MKTFNEEQEALKMIASNILLFAHQREQSNNLRQFSIQIGVSNENAEAVINVFNLLEINTESMSKKLETQLKAAIQICQRERQLKDTEDYFKAEEPNLINSHRRHF